MKQVQANQIWYNFDLNQPDPLDIRLRVETLNDLPPLERRYEGLIFFVKELNVPYIFLNNLNTPVPLFDLVNENNILGIEATNYATLIDDLNNTNPVLGSLITVFPLAITFVFDGTNWQYQSGEYVVTNETQYLTIPESLRKIGKRVFVGEDRDRFQISSENNKELVPEVTELSQLPTEFENNRFYKIDSVLYYSINGIFYKIGEQTKLIQNQTLIKGKTVIDHDLESTYICVLFWINDTTTVLRLTDYEIVSNNAIQIKSSTNVTGKMILTTIY